MQAYGYYVDQGDKSVQIMLFSNGKEISQDESDAFNEQACISF